MAATPMKEVVNLVNGETSRLGEFLSQSCGRSPSL